jgi:hypothetical protein
MIAQTLKSILREKNCDKSDKKKEKKNEQKDC